MATTTNNGWVTPDDTDLVKDGAAAIRSLGSAIDTSVGTGLLAWTSYTPTFTNFTLGNGTITYSKYVQLGKIVFLEVGVNLGSTSAVTGRIGISLPVNSVSLPNRAQGTVALSAGASSGLGSLAFDGGTKVDLYALNAAGTYLANANISATVPGTWASGSFFNFRTFYEAA
jgi:hypothetical protein